MFQVFPHFGPSSISSSQYSHNILQTRRKPAVPSRLVASGLVRLSFRSCRNDACYLQHTMYMCKVQLFFQIEHRCQYDQLPANRQNQHAMKLGIKGGYPDMALPYHDRVSQLAVGGMHTIKYVVCDIAVILDKKTFRIPSIALSKSALEKADERYRNLIIPKWIDLPYQQAMISNAKGLKSYDFKQVQCYSISFNYNRGLARCLRC